MQVQRDSGSVPTDDRRGWGAGPDQLDPGRRHAVQANDPPDTIAGWKALAEGLLADECCAFHRNMQISARYVWLYQLRPESLKWAAMAAFASHHVRLALFPFRLDSDGTGYVDLPRSLGRPKLLRLTDVDVIRATNNAIFDDIFWVHLVYGTDENGIERLRDLLRDDPHYMPVLAGFEAIDRGRRALEGGKLSAEARQAADDLVWKGTVQVLEHEQRAMVQPCFERLSCAFARLVSVAATTSFEVRGPRQAIGYFTSFYLHLLIRCMPQTVAARRWPRITRFEDRWHWLLTSVVPRFRRLEASERLLDARLRRIAAEAHDYASMPCVLPFATELTPPP